MAVKVRERTCEGHQPASLCRGQWSVSCPFRHQYQMVNVPVGELDEGDVGSFCVLTAACEPTILSKYKV